MNKLFSILFFALSPTAAIAQSQCLGTPRHGQLIAGEALPLSGVNFTSYSSMATLLDRNYVHSTVRDIVLATYQELHQQSPEKIFKYGETGHQQGGSFAPHKTHQNGLSVDFMTPMLDHNGQSQWLPSHIGNRFGYSIELTKQGIWPEQPQWRIDFTALAAHLLALSQQAQQHGSTIERVILAPELQKLLWQALANQPSQRQQLQALPFSRKPAWVRHDEHYHVDLGLPCLPLPPNAKKPA